MTLFYNLNFYDTMLGHSHHFLKCAKFIKIYDHMDCISKKPIAKNCFDLQIYEV